jgi:ornithine cyclodeaminase/alanine dehydrogenase-like protein (mu-crystallin family)
VLVLTAKEVRAALPMDQAIQAVKRAFAALSAGQAEVPLRSRLPIGPHNAVSLSMPAFVNTAQGEALALKVVGLFPSNPARGLAYIQAAVLVFEPDTGRPMGLLEGSSLTAIRTGAAGGAAIDLLSRPESQVVAIFGAGAQGRTQLEAACTVRRIRTAWIFDVSPQQAQNLAEEMAGHDPIPKDLRVASSPREAIAQADIVCTATTSSTPVFSDAELRPGTHISAVGSYTPDMQEIPAETVRRARVLVDSRGAALVESGDLVQPIRAGEMREDHISGELGELILGQVEGRQSNDQITLFKSVGVAVQDAMAASIVMGNAVKLNIGQVVDF